MLTHLIDEIASDEVINLAYAWLCKRRECYSHNQDVWNLRFHWETVRPELQANLRAGTYRLSSLHRIGRGVEKIELWSALDALVLKAIAIVLGRRLELSRSCYHLRRSWRRKSGRTRRGEPSFGQSVRISDRC